MWSIHPDQIRPILEAFAPSAQEIDSRFENNRWPRRRPDWAPISFEGKLQDRASYRYYWQVLERAHQTGRACLQKCRAGSTAPRPLNIHGDKLYEDP